MSSPLADAIANLCSPEYPTRFSGASAIYRTGRALADEATRAWQGHPGFSSLLGSAPLVTVGLAVAPATFGRISEENGRPPLAQVPPDQDAREFELHFPELVALDILTTRDPGGAGPIARYLSKFGEGIQQVEYRCMNVDRATAILRERFRVLPLYPQARAGADDTRINFFLAPVSGGGKVLIELYEIPGTTWPVRGLPG